MSFDERSLVFEQRSAPLANQSFEIVRRDSPSLRAVRQTWPSNIVTIANLALQRMATHGDDLALFLEARERGAGVVRKPCGG